MERLEDLVKDFLAQRSIAVVGVSDRRETGCNLAFRKLKQAGYQVFPVNPRLESFEGETCYPDLRSIPQRPDAVFVLARPSVTDGIVRECVDLGIGRVWMHCMMGTRPGLTPTTSSVSQAAVELCRKHGISVIPGSCPNQFLEPDGAHRLMRWLWTMLGFMRHA